MKIQEMYAFVADNGPEGEGIMGFKGPDGGWVPLVGADLTRVEQLKEIADQISKAAGIPYRILYFKLVGDITDSVGKENVDG